MVRQEGPGIGRSAAMVASVALFLFPLLMAFAAASDLLTMRISNGLVMAVVVAFSFAAFASGLPLAALGMTVFIGREALEAWRGEDDEASGRE